MQALTPRPDLARTVHLVALDTETLALGGMNDRIVQFCALELDETLTVRSEWTQLIHPGRPIPPGATAIHGITDDMVADAPPFSSVAARLRSTFRPETVLIAYNAGFDMGMLNLEFSRHGIPILPPDQRIIDPLEIERFVLSRSLGPTYTRYTGKKLENAHRADADTHAMVEVLRAQRAMHPHKLPADLEDLVGFSGRSRMRGSGPAAGRGGRRGKHFYRDVDGSYRFAFGKHEGKPAHEMPEYLQWMLEQDFPESAKRRARSLLKKPVTVAVTLM